MQPNPPTLSSENQPLTLTLSDGANYHVQPGGDLIIGRRSDCDVTLSDARVSRQHGRVRHTEHGWVYADLCSSNGTSINGWRCTEALIQPGDVIRIAGFDLAVSVVSGTDEVGA